MRRQKNMETTRSHKRGRRHAVIITCSILFPHPNFWLTCGTTNFIFLSPLPPPLATIHQAMADLNVPKTCQVIAASQNFHFRNPYYDYLLPMLLHTARSPLIHLTQWVLFLLLHLLMMMMMMMMMTTTMMKRKRVSPWIYSYSSNLYEKISLSTLSLLIIWRSLEQIKFPQTDLIIAVDGERSSRRKSRGYFSCILMIMMMMTTMLTSAYTPPEPQTFLH